MANTGLVLFGGRTEYPAVTQTQTSQLIDVPDLANVVYITIQPQAHAAIIALFERWFEGRNEVELVDHGTSDKLGESFLVIEWFECEIDQLFLDILNTEDMIIDYTTYSREVD